MQTADFNTSEAFDYGQVEDDKVVGIVSIGDLVNWIISAQADTIHHLHSYITGKYPG